MVTAELETIVGHLRHFDYTLVAGLEDAVAKGEGFAEADGEDVGVIGDGTNVLAVDPDGGTGLGVDGLDFGAGAFAEEPVVGAAVVDGRVEREMLASNAIERRRHKRRCHF